jgi:N-acetylmuramoyl-L-alanine amidase
MRTTIEIQRRLLDLGYSLPKFGADGHPGTETSAAVSAFQKASGLPVTGKVDVETETALFLLRVEAPGAVASVLGQPKAARPITEIIVHCTATPEGRDVSVDTIRGWHKAQGWKDIGYHHVVLLDGTIEAGRPEAIVGSHVMGHNTGTLGVVYVGGVAADGKTPKDTRTPAQRASLLRLVKALIAKYPTVTKVTGHNQYAAKACPSFDVRKDELGALP